MTGTEKEDGTLIFKNKATIFSNTRIMNIDNQSVKKLYETDFADGVQVSKKDLGKWSREVLEKLINSEKDDDFTLIGSGNSVVFGIKDLEGIDIFEVSKGYRFKEYSLPTKSNA